MCDGDWGVQLPVKVSGVTFANNVWCGYKQTLRHGHEVALDA